MQTIQTQKYRRLTLVQGGLSPIRGRRRGRRTRTAAELVLDRDMHTTFVQLVTPAGTVASESIQKVREHEQNPWRILARRIVEAHAAQVDHQRVRAIALTLLTWIDRLYAKSDETVREIVLYQGPTFQRWIA